MLKPFVMLNNIINMINLINCIMIERSLLALLQIELKSGQGCTSKQQATFKDLHRLEPNSGF